jgi:hypothetical protein
MTFNPSSQAPDLWLEDQGRTQFERAQRVIPTGSTSAPSSRSPKMLAARAGKRRKAVLN